MPTIGTTENAERIATSVRHLPPLPAVVRKLLLILEDYSCSAADIERVVATDPALTARILKLANSPLYKGIDAVATVSQAVTRLGFWKLKDVAISVGTTATLSELADETVQQEYWHHALQTATCARILANVAGLPLPEETFVAGLLHDIGELVLAAVAPVEFGRFQRIAPHERLGREAEVFGATHPRIGTMLLRQWLLPKPLCDMVRLHHTEQVYTSSREPVISLVALADVLSQVNGIGAEPKWSARTLFQVAKRAGVPLGAIADVLGQVDDQIADTQRHLEVGGDMSFLTPPRSSRNYRVVVMSADAAVTQWLEQLVAYHRHTLVTPSAFLTDPDTAHLVILDPAATAPRLLPGWREALAHARDRLVLCETGEQLERGTLQEWNLPTVGLFLQRDEIDHHARSLVAGHNQGGPH